MCVDFLLHHGHHVKGITHGVEAKDARKHLEASPRKDRVTFTTPSVCTDYVLSSTVSQGFLTINQELEGSKLSDALQFSEGNINLHPYTLWQCFTLLVTFSLPFLCSDFLSTLRACVHVISI